MQLVETETSPAAAPPAGACGARLSAPLSAHPQLDQAHHLHDQSRRFRINTKGTPQIPRNAAVEGVMDNLAG